jgi:2',3'-cyclic-nucleotide 2'-phosphodiesterase (5'-nucleotidase family)
MVTKVRSGPGGVESWSADALIDGALVFFQLNDLYHVDAKSDYADPASLVLPRVSTLLARGRAALGRMNIPSQLVVAGDFLAPSCLSKHVYGAQMVGLLDQLGTNYVTFGNHEFETFKGLRAKPRPFSLFEMMGQSRFTWLASNFEFADHPSLADLRSSGRLRPYVQLPLGAGRDIVLLGLLYAGDKREFHGYGSARDPVEAAREWMARLGPAPNRAFVALTHQHLADDLRLVKQVAGLPLIMGGHDHSVTFLEKGRSGMIVKAESDARTLRVNWIVSLSPGALQIAFRSQLSGDGELLRSISNALQRKLGVPLMTAMLGQTSGKRPSPEHVRAIGDFFALGGPSPRPLRDKARGLPEGPTTSFHFTTEGCFAMFSLTIRTSGPGFPDLVPADPDVTRYVEQWRPDSYHDPATVAVAPETWELGDEIVRRRSTDFGNLVADVFRGALAADLARRCDVGLVNAGSFRIDRRLVVGEKITRQTICDIFFHANGVRRYQLSGRALQEILQVSVDLRQRAADGHGDFLQIAGLSAILQDGKVQAVQVAPLEGRSRELDPAKVYSVATTDYVASRCEAYRDFFAGQAGEELEDDVEECMAGALAALGTLPEPKRAGLLRDIADPRWLNLPES